MVILQSYSRFSNTGNVILNNSAWIIKSNEKLIKSMVNHHNWNKTILSVGLLLLVVLMNYSVISLISHISKDEILLLFSGKIEGSDRAVGSSILMALIGGTVAEVSALLFIVVKWFFPQKNT